MLQKVLVSCFSATLWLTIVYPQTGGDSKEVQQLQTQAARLDDEARQNTGNQPVFESLSKQLNVPVDVLQADKQNTGFGFGQLFIAHSLAQASGQSFDQLAGEFRAGKGWGEIAKENNLKLGKVVSGLKRAGNDLKAMRTERMHPEHPNQGHQQGHEQGVSHGHGPVGGSKAKGGGPRH